MSDFLRFAFEPELKCMFALNSLHFAPSPSENCAPAAALLFFAIFHYLFFSTKLFFPLIYFAFLIIRSYLKHLMATICMLIMWGNSPKAANNEAFINN